MTPQKGGIPDGLKEDHMVLIAPPLTLLLPWLVIGGIQPKPCVNAAEWVFEKVKVALPTRGWLLMGATVVAAGEGDQH